MVISVDITCCSRLGRSSQSAIKISETWTPSNHSHCYPPEKQVTKTLLHCDNDDFGMSRNTSPSPSWFHLLLRRCRRKCRSSPVGLNSTPKATVKTFWPPFWLKLRRKAKSSSPNKMEPQPTWPRKLWPFSRGTAWLHWAWRLATLQPRIEPYQLLHLVGLGAESLPRWKNQQHRAHKRANSCRLERASADLNLQSHLKWRKQLNAVADKDGGRTEHFIGKEKVSSVPVTER